MQKGNKRLQLGFFLLFIILIGFVTDTNTDGRDESSGVLYSGVHKCDSTQIKVSFIYNALESTIKNFKCTIGCIKGATASYQHDPIIKVQKNGSFNFNAGPSIIKGTIYHDGYANGVLDGHMSTASFKCDDGRVYPVCTVWDALIVK